MQIELALKKGGSARWEHNNVKIYSLLMSMKRRSLVGTRAVRHIMRFPLGFDFLNLPEYVAKVGARKE